MAARKRTITKLILAFAVACLLTITPQPTFSQDVDQLIQQGITAGERGDISAAESIFRQVIEIDPNNSAAYNNLGITLHDQGKFEEAIASYEKAIELEPNDSDAYNNLGNALLYDQGKFEEAIASYEKAIELNPNYALAYYNLGNALLYDQGKFEEAIASYEKSIELDPNYALAFLNLGSAKYFQGKLEEAISYYQKAIEINPSDASAYIGRGNVLHEQRKLEEAISSYEKAIELNPNNAFAYNNLGNVLRDQEKLEAAIKQYKRSLKIDSELITAKNNLREAERLLAIKLNPTSPDIDDTKHLPSVEDEPLVIALRSTARIIAQVSAEGTSIGAGWVVKKEGNTVWIVTNRHVVSDRKTKISSKKIEVEFFSELPDKDRPRYPATIINSTEKNDSLDLAVLEVTGIPDDIQSLELSPGRIRRNTNVVVVGHPYIDEIPWSTELGRVKNYNPNNSKISMSGLFAQGNSGGPVLNSENQVIAMMVGIRTDSDIPVAVLDQQNLNIDVNQPATGGVGLAYRIDVVVDQLREWGIISEQVNSKQ